MSIREINGALDLPGDPTMLGMSERVELARWFNMESRGRLTVHEYAAKHGVSAGRIRALMAAGRLPFKRGPRFQVWIDQDLPYPTLLRNGTPLRGGEPNAGIRARGVDDFTWGGGNPFGDVENLRQYCFAAGLSEGDIGVQL